MPRPWRLYPWGFIWQRRPRHLAPGASHLGQIDCLSGEHPRAFAGRTGSVLADLDPARIAGLMDVLQIAPQTFHPFGDPIAVPVAWSGIVPPGPPLCERCAPRRRRRGQIKPELLYGPKRRRLRVLMSAGPAPRACGMLGFHSHHHPAQPLLAALAALPFVPRPSSLARRERSEA